MISRVCRSAGDDGLVLEGVCPVTRRNSTRRLTVERDLLRIAAELLDVVRHPLHGEVVVEEAQVLRGLRRAREPKDVHAKVECDKSSILGGDEVGPVVERRI